MMFNIQDLKKYTISKRNSQYIANIDLFDKLLYGANKYDLELLIVQIPYLDDCDSCRQYLSEFSGDLDKIIETSPRALYIENNRLNNKLLQELKTKGCISSFSEEDSLLH